MAGRSGAVGSAVPETPPTAKRREVQRTAPGDRLAVALVRAIEADIVRRGWPVGQNLGGEPELIERYGVSRAVFREAVRMLDVLRVARMRTGPGGGLTVIEPDPAAVVHSAELYLGYRAVTPQQLYEAREMIEIASVRKATETLDEAGRKRLRTVIEDEREVLSGARNSGFPATFTEFHVLIAELADNPAVHLFAEILSGLAVQSSRKRTAQERKEIRDTGFMHHASIGEAMLEGDEALAVHRMRMHLRWIESVQSRRRSPRSAK